MGVCDISNKPANLDKRESLSLYFFFHSLLFCGFESNDSVPYKTAKPLTPNLGRGTWEQKKRESDQNGRRRRKECNIRRDGNSVL